MSPLLILIMLLMILMLAMAGSTYAHMRQQSNQKRQQQIQYLRKRAEHYSEVAAAMASVADNPELAKEINKLSIAGYEQILSLSSQAEFAEAALGAARNFDTMVRVPMEEDRLALFTSEIAISRIRSYLGQAERILRSRRDTGDLEASVFEAYLQELRWLYLQCEIDYLSNMGNLANSRNNRVKAKGFWQKALNTLKKSGLNDPRRQDKINDLGRQLDAIKADS